MWKSVKKCLHKWIKCETTSKFNFVLTWQRCWHYEYRTHSHSGSGCCWADNMDRLQFPLLLKYKLFGDSNMIRHGVFFALNHFTELLPSFPKVQFETQTESIDVFFDYIVISIFRLHFKKIFLDQRFGKRMYLKKTTFDPLSRFDLCSPSFFSFFWRSLLRVTVKSVSW